MSNKGEIPGLVCMQSFSPSVPGIVVAASVGAGAGARADSDAGGATNVVLRAWLARM